VDIKKLIYGASDLQGIVSCEYANNGQVEIILNSGESKFQDIPLFLVSDLPAPGWQELKGNLPLKYIKTFKSKEQLWDEKRRNRRANHLHVYDERDSAMMLGGFTSFKGLQPKDVSTLAFDIEATGLEHGPDSKTLLISNTFQHGNTLIKKLFAYDEFSSDADMLMAWAEWVRKVNPSIVAGHNIFAYDLPYLNYCARRNGIKLHLGRDGSALEFDKYESKFRRDGSQFYTYNNAHIYGRNIVDTFFLSIKFDISRNYESYGLKSIIKAEGLERPGRVHYDASKIRQNYLIKQEWEKIKEYAQDDSDDALKVFNLMIPAYFYLAQSVPMSFQNIINKASGAQINSLLVRSYLQENHSLPLPSEPEQFEGAISIGNPGVYHNVFKVDVASLYPSIMLEWQVSDKEKDPLGATLQMLEYLTAERLENKKRAKDTGQRKFKDLESAQKIIINSMYGLLGAPGINFNSPKNAALVTTKGREILERGINLAESSDFLIANADTDSVSITGKYNSHIPWTEDSKKMFLSAWNTRFPERIRWEDDGVYDRVLVLKAKNYVLSQNGKLKIKGSALKASMKEPALKEFIHEIIDALITNNSHTIPKIYTKYVQEILNVYDIERWSFKKTITSSVLNPGRTNERKVLDALDGSEYLEGDKKYFYFVNDDSLALADTWNHKAPNHNVAKLLEKLYKTMVIFKPVYDITQCLNYKLKRNHKLLQTLNSN
jgi:DNA polymerase I